MHDLAHPLDVAATAELASLRHRPARAGAFPAPEAGDYEAREAAYLRALLTDPLRAIAATSADVAARAIADGTLACDVAADDPFADHARFEEALERIASTTADDDARAIAEDAVALYRGR